LEPEAITKKKTNIYGIDQFQTISLNGKPYMSKIPYRRMGVSYISIQNYSSIEDITFLKERGILYPYNTSTIHIFLLLYTIEIPYFYCCAS